MTPPHFGQVSHDSIVEGLRDQRAQLDESHRRDFAVWMKHMLALKFASPREVATAFSAEYPFCAIDRLLVLTSKRIAQHMNRIVHTHAESYDEHCRAAIEVSLCPAGHGDDYAALRLATGGMYDFPVSALHRMPADLAAMVYDALELVSRSYTDFMLPHELWEGASGGVFDMKEEYQELCKLGGSKNLPALIQAVKNGQYYHFGGSDEEIACQFEVAREMFENRPVWMQFHGREQLITYARRLRQRVQSYHARRATRPWCDYVEYVCVQLFKSFPNDQSLKCYRELHRKNRLEYEELQVALCMGLLVHTSSECEIEHMRALEQEMMDVGEESIDRISLRRLASKDLGQILDNTAIGIGLMARAAAINERVSRKYR